MNNGGAETLAIRLAEKLSKSEFQTAVCSLSDSGPLRDVLVEKKIPFFTLGKKEGKDFSLIWKLKKLLKEQQIDIVHTHNQGPLLYTYLATLIGYKPKIVHTEHINMAKEFSYSKKHIFYNNLIYRSIDGFLSIAQHLTDDFRKRYNLSHALVTTVHNSIELSAQNYPPRGNLRKELGLSSDTPLIGNISALRPQKDHGTLIKAMALVTKQIQNAVLVIAGEGESETELRGMVKKLELEDNVIFLGYRSDISAILPQLNLFVLPSLYEGLPLCVLEAMEAGRPIVATDVEGTNELIRHKLTGMLTPAKDPETMAEAITTILSDPGLAEKMGTAARELVENEYNMDIMIQRYEEYYQQIMRRQKLT